MAKPRVRATPIPDISKGLKKQPTKRKPARKPQTIGDLGERALLQESVDRARKRPKVRADTGDVLKGTTKPKGGLKKELEGQGKLARGSEKAGKSQLVQRAGREALGPVGHVAALAKFAGLGAPDKIVTNLIHDAINLPSQAIPSLYVPVAAAYEAIKGDDGRAKKLVKDIKEQDPFYALGEGAVRTVKGDEKGAKESFKRAGKQAVEHPGFTAIEGFGLKGTAGRFAGRATRGAGKLTGSERVTNYATVKGREPAVIKGTNLQVRREYDRDLIRKRVQVRADARKKAEARALRDRAGELGDTEQAMALRKRANEVDPTVASARQIRGRVDLIEARGENRRVSDRSERDKTVQQILKQADDKGAAPVLVSTGITKAAVADLRVYQAQLRKAHDGLTDPDKRARNVELRQAIDKSVENAKRKGDLDLRGVLSAAKRYKAEVDAPLNKILDEMGILPAARSEKAALIPFAAREMGATVDKKVRLTEAGAMRRDAAKAVRSAEGELMRTGAQEARTALTEAKQSRALIRLATKGEPKKAAAGLVANGKRLSTEDVKRVYDREVEPSYVSQAPNAGGRGDYFRASDKEPTVGAKRRTEKPTIEGTFSADPELLRASAIRRQGLATAGQNFRAFISEMGRRDEGGKVMTNLSREKAEKLARKIEQDEGLEFDLVAVRPWAAAREHIQKIQEAVDAGHNADPRLAKGLNDALDQAFSGAGDGPFALIPREAAKQARQHLRVLDPTDAGKVLRAVRSAFTRTVLSTAVGPTIGNVVEPSFRAVVMRAGPTSAYRGFKTMRSLKRMDPEAYRQFVATVGRGQVTLASRKRYVDPMQFDRGWMRETARRWEMFKTEPGPKQAVAAWDLWTHFVFDVVNGRVEQFYRQGPFLGKILRDSGLMDDSLSGLTTKAFEEAARGLTDTSTQAMVTAKLNDGYGKYQGLSPSGRKVIAEYTPFAAWWLSAANFVFHVLPRDHPTLLALTASMEAATEEWRKTLGLDWFAKNRLPGWLMGTVPMGDSRAKLAYNTPFGAFTDPLQAAQSLVLPQGATILKAFQGLDWKNKPLRNEDGSEYTPDQQLLYALGETLKSTVPAVAVATKGKRYAEDPGTLLNPVRIKITPKKKKPRVSVASDPVDKLLNQSADDIEKYLDLP